MRKIVFSAILAALSTSVVPAASFDLFTLISTNGSFTVGDKIFSDFSGVITGGGSFTPAAPLAAGDVTIETLQTGNLFGFKLISALSAASVIVPGSGAIPFSFSDLALGYNVSTTSGLPLINDLHLTVNGGCTVIGFGICQITVTEDALDSNSQSLLPSGQPLQVSIPGSGTTAATDLVRAVSSLRITKDINLTTAVFGTAAAQAVASVSIVEQLVSQTTVVPEPGFYGALALGLTVLFWLRRRPSGA